jgi:hypothetical protein
MKHGQISSDGSLARLVVVFFGCGLLSYLLVMRFWGGGSEPTNTARPALSQYKPSIPRSNAPVSLGHSSRSPSLAPPEWDRTSSVPEITIPELSQLDLVALESHDDIDRAQKFARLRSATIRTMSPVIATARVSCLGGSKLAPSTIRLRLTIQSNPNSGAEVASVREVIGFAGVPLRERALTCILDELKKHPFPVPITSVPRSDLVTFVGETFVRAHL